MTPTELIAAQKDAIEALRMELDLANARMNELEDQIAIEQEAAAGARVELEQTQRDLEEAQRDLEEVQRDLEKTVEELEKAENKLASIPDKQIALCHDVLRAFGAAVEDVPFDAVTNTWLRDIEYHALRSDYYHDPDC